MNPLLNDVQQLQKVGPKSRQILNDMGISRICDLLTYFPRTYEQVKDIEPIASLTENDTVYIKGSIVDEPQLLRLSGKMMVQCQLQDESGKIKLIFFNQPYMKHLLIQGDEIIVQGKYIIKNRRKMIANPKVIKPEEFQRLTQIQLKPIYPLVKSIKLKQLTQYIEQSLHIMGNEIIDYLSDELREKHELASINFAYEKIHFPLNEKNLSIAKRRLIFDEFFLFQLAMRQIKDKIIRTSNAFVIRQHPDIVRFIQGLPFQLTHAQKVVINEIATNMSSPMTMTRLVQGDVGSGKTIIATIALLSVIKSGYQGALMAPTEVLAKQHYHSLSNQLKPLGVRVELLIGSTPAKARQSIYTGLEDGTVNLLIGTHALIQEKVEFKELALVVCDEQHRFGVMQRESLINKGRFPHNLVMSATPIPRTLALILYGDLDISIVGEMPANRKPIETFLVDSSYRERLNQFIIKQVEEGRNVYIVCPLIEDDEGKFDHLTSVEEHFTYLRDILPASISIEKLHGKMKGQEKVDVMERFLSFTTQVIISTTVIEVGVNIPNATLMIIENAERFGLAQLHQLRGRVGRSDHQSFCVLVSNVKNPETRNKLMFLKNHWDGFEIAAYDLKTRGMGDAFGTMQHGIPFFRLANIYEDIELLELAREIAAEYVFDEKVEKQIEMFYYKLNEKISL